MFAMTAHPVTGGFASTAETVPSAGSVLDLAPFRAATVHTDPYPHIMARGCLQKRALSALWREFPRLRQTGFHPIDSLAPVGVFAQLLKELEGPEVAAVMSDKLGVELRGLPRLVTVRGVSAAHEDRPHTESTSNVATFLLYLRHAWRSPESRLRILRTRDRLDAWVTEISEEEGNALGFLHSDHSWRSLTPFVGERCVVQVAWLSDAREIDHTKRRQRMSRLLKSALGRVGLEGRRFHATERRHNFGSQDQGPHGGEPMNRREGEGQGRQDRPLQDLELPRFRGRLAARDHVRHQGS